MFRVLILHTTGGLQNKNTLMFTEIVNRTKKPLLLAFSAHAEQTKYCGKTA